MKHTYERGQRVKVKVYGGEVIERMVVADLGRSVIVCVKQEYASAENEGREPNGIGFPKGDVSATQN